MFREETSVTGLADFTSAVLRFSSSSLPPIMVKELEHFNTLANYTESSIENLSAAKSFFWPAAAADAKSKCHKGRSWAVCLYHSTLQIFLVLDGRSTAVGSRKPEPPRPR
jgi:hypothetical protein